jgi:hypothetical protein
MNMEKVLVNIYKYYKKCIKITSSLTGERPKRMLKNDF